MTELTVSRNEPSRPYPGSPVRLQVPEASGAVGLADDRFHRLLGREAWATLPDSVRRRFSKHLAPGEVRRFVGEVTETTLSRAGRILARLGRLAGGPLPDTDGAIGPATVIVTEDAGLGGQVWTRTYARPGGFPQTINSVKRFRGPTGLEEYLGYGLVMRLTLHAEAGALVFRSSGYDLDVLGRRLALPRWLTPGRCTIIHLAEGGDRFSFTLALDHPRLGRLVRQVATFEEVAA